jgi:hypothetical protein
MNTTISINGKDVEITLTPDQIKKIKETKTEITERIKTFEDACEHQGVNVDEFYSGCKNLTIDEIAYKKLKIIAKALNENKEPDWNNSNEGKYYPYFDMRSTSGFGFSGAHCGDWRAYTYCGSRLSFRSSKLAEYAGSQFTSIYKELFT